MPLTVRPRTDNDLDELVRALREVHQLDGYPVEGVNDPRGWLNLPMLHAAWTAEIDDAPVGHVALTPAQPDAPLARLLHETYPDRTAGAAEVARLFVAPEARNLGAARSLMRALMDFAANHHLTVGLEVLTKDQAAIELYRSLGFIQLGTHVHVGPDGDSPTLLFGQPSGAARDPDSGTM